MDELNCALLEADDADTVELVVEAVREDKRG